MDDMRHAHCARLRCRFHADFSYWSSMPPPTEEPLRWQLVAGNMVRQQYGVASVLGGGGGGRYIACAIFHGEHPPVNAPVYVRAGQDWPGTLKMQLAMSSLRRTLTWL